jgi:hypothetical protein
MDATERTGVKSKLLPAVWNLQSNASLAVTPLCAASTEIATSSSTRTAAMEVRLADEGGIS